MLLFVGLSYLIFPVLSDSPNKNSKKDKTKGYNDPRKAIAEKIGSLIKQFILSKYILSVN
jgi:hypothetical protein